MKRIIKNLFVGSLPDYRSVQAQDWAFVHATQTVHYSLFDWDRKCNKPPKNHPNYIKWQKDNRFSLNWVDGAAELYEWSGLETFIEVLDFIDKWIERKPVLIHCDQGQSRSPTLGLLYLAKRKDSLPNDNFLVARAEFVKIYPEYYPSGIADYVTRHWGELA